MDARTRRVGALLAVVVCLIGARAPAQDSADILAWPDVNGGKAIFIHSDFKCVTLSLCPAGTRLRDASTLNYLGCTNPSGTGCRGDCILCSGSTATAMTCRSARGQDCAISPSFGTFTCLSKSTVGCVYWATPSAGEPYITPNKCYCTGTTGTLTGTCLASNCS